MGMSTKQLYIESS